MEMRDWETFQKKLLNLDPKIDGFELVDPNTMSGSFVDSFRHKIPSVDQIRKLKPLDWVRLIFRSKRAYVINDTGSQLIGYNHNWVLVLKVNHKMDNYMGLVHGAFEFTNTIKEGDLISFNGRFIREIMTFEEHKEECPEYYENLYNRLNITEKQLLDVMQVQKTNQQKGEIIC